MKLKQAILSVMGRDALKATVDVLELGGVDRRSVDDMRARLSRGHRATPELLLEHLGEDEVKDVCHLVGVAWKGRRGALVEALLQADLGGSPPRPHRGERRDRETTDEGDSTTPRRGRSEAVVDDEPLRWMRPEEAEMSGQPTDKPEAQRPGEPGRPFQITRTELVWPGKYDERGDLVEAPPISLPFQVVEVIEEGRTSRESLKQAMLPLFGEQPKGPGEESWRNKLIWGDNLLVEASLLKEFAGKIDLIYIDPPFATGADFSFTAAIGNEGLAVEKSQSAIEAKAYRDTWGQGVSSYLGMLRPRLHLMRDLLADGGVLYLHIGPDLSHLVRIIADEIFGADSFLNEIIWKRTPFAGSSKARANRFPVNHDAIIFYVKRVESFQFNHVYEDYTDEYKARFKYKDERGHYRKTLLKTYSMATEERLRKEGRWIDPIRRGAYPSYKQYLHESKGKQVEDIWGWEQDEVNEGAGSVWEDLNLTNPMAVERTGYPTQKPEVLLDRIIRASSKEGDLVADFFSGSGTTVAVAEKLGRRWIGCDLGRFAIHTTRKRLLDLRVRDTDTGKERGCRPFEVLNLGKYERKYWHGITFGNEPRSDEETALAAYVRFILDLYKAQPVQAAHVHGKKGGALVHVGAVDAPVTIAQIEEAAVEAQRFGGKELHILGWEFEMGLHDPITQYVRAQHGVTVRLLSIPRETMDKRAVEAGDVQFFDLAYLELEVKREKSGKKDRAVKAVLKDFVIPSTDLIPEEVRAKIRKWSDYIDYWAVDWDFRNDTFVNQWQTYRTRQDRSLALETPAHSYDKPGAYQILVKVVDIFGNDTSHLVRWEVK